MKLYFGTWLFERSQKDALDARGAPHRLLSYKHISETPLTAPRPDKGPVPLKEYLTMVAEKRKSPQPIELMLDSGAYSAWTQGAKIDIDAYADFILAHPTDFAQVVSLDVIPGDPRRVATGEERDRAAQQSWENWRYLCKKLAPLKLMPIPTFHVGEDEKWLRKLMNETDYIGLGGMAGGMTTDARLKWLDWIMRRVVDERGEPICRFHGFGMTGVSMMTRYPWYSVDSTSWVLTGRFGAVFVPLPDERGEMVAHKVIFSGKSPKAADPDSEHFDTFSPPAKKRVLAYLAEMGFTPKELAEDYIKRDEANIAFFLRLEREWVARPFNIDDSMPTFEDFGHKM